MSLTLFQIPLKIAVWTDFMQTWQRKRSKKPRIFLYLYSVMMQVQVLVSVPVVIWEKCTSFIFKRNILSRFYEMLIVLTLCEVVTYNLLPTDTMIYKDRLKLRLHQKYVLHWFAQLYLIDFQIIVYTIVTVTCVGKCADFP